MIRVDTATERDLDDFAQVLEEAARWLWERKILQWEPGTQRSQRERMAGWMREGALLLIREEGHIRGGCIVTRVAVDGWEQDGAPAAYLYKLAVARSAARNGLGDRLLEAAADWARGEGLSRLRLDCWDGNAVLRRFYRERSFTELRAATTHGFEVRLFERRL